MRKDNIDHFFLFGLETSTRTIYMGSRSHDDSAEESGTDYSMAEHTIKGLHLLDSMAPSGERPIQVIMNNPGGDVYHGLAIFDAIRACRNHVTIKVFGSAMSMGSIILQAADERLMSPNSKLMLHYGQWSTTDHPKSFYNWAEESKKLDKWMLDLFLERIREKQPKFKRDKLDKMCNFDTILSAGEAIALGLADKVL